METAGSPVLVVLASSSSPRLPSPSTLVRPYISSSKTHSRFFIQRPTFEDDVGFANRLETRGDGLVKPLDRGNEATKQQDSVRRRGDGNTSGQGEWRGPIQEEKSAYWGNDGSYARGLEGLIGSGGEGAQVPLGLPAIEGNLPTTLSNEGDEELARREFVRVDLPLPTSKKANVRRKPAANPRDKLRKDSQKEGNRRRPKSEAMIINSDEPDTTTDLTVKSAETIHTEDGNSAAHEQAKMPPICLGKTFKPKTNHIQRTPVKAIATKHTTPLEPYARHPEQAVTTKELDNSPLGDSVAILHRRRRNWTPAKNTAIVLDANEGYNELQPVDSPIPIPSLTALIRDFNHIPAADRLAVSTRITTGGAITKRRRISLTDVSTGEHHESNAVKRRTTEPVKRVKSAKKPTTITDLATAAFRPEAVENAEQCTISGYFEGPQNAAGERFNDIGEHQTGQPSKQPSTSKKRTRAKPPKVKKAKPDQTETQPKLLSPQQARACEKSQDFIFGTSSQLAIEESPTFLRQIQAAIGESEMISVSQTKASPQRTSCIKVPTAPHGTNLSIEQAERSLWCTAARDDAGLVVAPHVSDALNESQLEDQGLRLHVETSLYQNENASTTACRFVDLSEVSPRRELEQEVEVANDDQSAALKHRYVGEMHTTNSSPSPTRPESLDLFEPLHRARQEHEPSVSLIEDLTPPDPEIYGELHAKDSSPKQLELDADWMLLSSNESTPKASRHSLEAVSAELEHYKPPRFLSPTNQSPCWPRSALQTLDANINVYTNTSSLKASVFAQQRPMSTKASKETSSPTFKRPRGRPRKDAAVTTKPTSPKPKRKSSSIKASNSRSVHPSSTKVIGTTTPTRSKDASSTVWADIDEIADSDSDLLVTPSPPRRPARSPPAVIPPLDFHVAEAANMESKGKSLAALAIEEAGEANWSDNLKTIFPQITQTIRSAPPSQDMNRPSWHEKILLYDPIVLEDLTAWLNDQGLRIEIARLKYQPIARGRKRKGKDPAPPEPEYEVISEPLKPWMIQKWCQAKSVCCLWKENLRGGVRTTRY